MSTKSKSTRPWTARDIPDQKGRTAVVTGANSGLGLQVALELARHGAQVVLACRDPGRGQEALGRVREQVPAAAVTLAELDLADLASVRAFAAAYVGPLDLLVNNAGVMAIPPRLTEDGFEMQFGTNHLGHFALTGLLIGALQRSPAARVVTVASEAARMGQIDFADLQSVNRYRKWAVYGQSKLANLLFARELDRRARAAGAPLSSVAAHPGYAATNLQSAGPRLQGSRVGAVLSQAANRVFAQSDAQGALPLLFAATAPDVAGGSYVGPDGLLGMRGHPTDAKPPRQARDDDVAARLWAESERLTGVRFDTLPPVS
ncbi:MAG: oxidoreductase [Actinomycetota bacterium]|nr:oxidoreductase [Actinomycetota bacterium]